ncbi:MAG: hypothetical protein KGL98_10670 [Gammaproteobacteria bacterium]|nr:hypothetical protein [Gammaproteobacteria bacterium]MBU6509838.1 hypothetical protein [Gammaproteobacteria bacterium]MDE1983644.1 hypothetical protein [Gammaproteobacteria bacterium]MDE2108592.1 hypothetical protein [Gammaproteobacteria bacterium]MDE2461695.1 hypothetical protein [Gammaproteobacteria bacterium]
MSAFDSERFNGFVRKELDDLLFSDLWNLDYFHERDMHAAAYVYIREYFAKHGRDNIYVRCEPRMNGAIPDIAIFDQTRPVYVLEFKMLMDPDRLDSERVYKDLDKMNKLINVYPSIKWGFSLLIHDDDASFRPVDATLRRYGYNRISITSVNARRQEDNDRRRVGYDGWRDRFDQLTEAHKQYT